MTRRRYEEVAEALKANPPELSELRMAAMERQLLESVRGGHRPHRTGVGRWAMASGVAVAVAAAWFLMARDPSAGESPAVAVGGDPMDATFAIYTGEVAGSAGSLPPRTEFSTAVDERVDVEQGMSTLRLEPSSQALFHSVDDDSIRIDLSLGTLSVEFHPAVPGLQPLVIDTPSARVEVVGTVFSVDVSPEGHTRVEVSEGVVAVTDLSTEEVHEVIAGGERLVEAVLDEIPETETEADDGEADVDIPPELQSGRDAGPRRLSASQRFRRAERSFDEGQYDAVRQLLLPIAASSSGGGQSARALTIVAESHTREGNYGLAAGAYRRAASLSGGADHGANAAFALGRLLERNLGDEEGASAAYRQYLDRAPEGVLATQAEVALCRLGDDSACDGP